MPPGSTTARVAGCGRRPEGLREPRREATPSASAHRRKPRPPPLVRARCPAIQAPRHQRRSSSLRPAVTHAGPRSQARRRGQVWGPQRSERVPGMAPQGPPAAAPRGSQRVESAPMARLSGSIDEADRQRQRPDQIRAVRRVRREVPHPALHALAVDELHHGGEEIPFARHLDEDRRRGRRERTDRTPGVRPRRFARPLRSGSGPPRGRVRRRGEPTGSPALATSKGGSPADDR